MEGLTKSNKSIQPKSHLIPSASSPTTCATVASADQSVASAGTSCPTNISRSRCTRALHTASQRPPVNSLLLGHSTNDSVCRVEMKPRNSDAAFKNAYSDGVATCLETSPNPQPSLNARRPRSLWWHQCPRETTKCHLPLDDRPSRISGCRPCCG